MEMEKIKMKNIYEIQIFHKNMDYKTICRFYKFKNAKTMFDRLLNDPNFRHINFRIIRTILTLSQD